MIVDLRSSIPKTHLNSEKRKYIIDFNLANVVLEYSRVLCLMCWTVQYIHTYTCMYSTYIYLHLYIYFYGVLRTIRMYRQTWCRNEHLYLHAWECLRNWLIGSKNYRARIHVWEKRTLIYTSAITNQSYENVILVINRHLLIFQGYLLDTIWDMYCTSTCVGLTWGCAPCL